MVYKITSYRRTKKGNWAFSDQSKDGEIVLNPYSEKCRRNFIKYFPHMEDRVRDVIEREFNAAWFIDKYFYAHPVLEPIKTGED